MNEKENTIVYSVNKEDLVNLKIKNFFVGWFNKPNEEILRKSIVNSDYIVIAIDKKEQRLAGYITAISDNTLSAYIPFLEVDPDYQKKGIGGTLVKMMIEQLDKLYMIDIVCDKNLAGFYEKAGFRSWHAMIKRNYINQSGASPKTNN